MNRPSKKVFSFIHGGEVRIAPKTKVIPADQISTMQDAQELLIQVQNDAETYKKQVVTEIEKLKEEAQKEGFVT